MKKGKKQLTLENRIFIENMLHEGKTIKEIARVLDKSTSTISREIRKHHQKNTKLSFWKHNQCKKAATCRLTGVCNRAGCHHRCAACRVVKCNDMCSQCEYVECKTRLSRAGQVCNGCKLGATCRHTRFFYVGKVAHDEYLKTLVETREGANISEGELKYLDGVVSPAIMKGQSLHHICIANAGRITVNERTLRRYVDKGHISARRGDMKRACVLKQRKMKSEDYQHKVETGCYIGRTYDAYLAYTNGGHDDRVVMMDLVIGRPGGKCLLTLHFQNAAFMVAFLIDNKCAENVVSVYDHLWNKLGPELFRRVFPIVLTDRGTEFSSPLRLETAPDGKPRTHIFYCDPMNSNQKSRLERNHELIREVLPKGTSFDSLSQKKVDLMMSHINAYVRLSHDNKTPYDAFEYLYGKGVAEKLGIVKIDPRRVCLKPSLVGIVQPTLLDSLKKK